MSATLSNLSSNTEGSFVLASVTEFLKTWASGKQSSLHLECANGEAWLQLGFRLSHFDSCHSLNARVFSPPSRPKSKSPSKKKRDRKRAEAFDSKKKNGENSTLIDSVNSTADPVIEQHEPLPNSLTASSQSAESNLDLQEPLVFYQPEITPCHAIDGECRFCNEEFTAWEDFFKVVKIVKYICVNCLGFLAGKSWFPISDAVMVDVDGGILVLVNPEGNDVLRLSNLVPNPPYQ